MLSSFERYLKRHNYVASVVAGHEFAKMREVLKCKQKDLKSKGFGNRPNVADSISDQELDLLYEREQLGSSTPESLLNTLWLNNTLIFGMRGGSAEHRLLCWGDVQLRYDAECEAEYLEYNERQTKTRTGIDVSNIRKVKPKMFATGDSRCPVAMYKAFARKRPEAMNKPDSPFYLGVVTHNNRPTCYEQWFLSQAVGVNKLRTLMKRMAEKANLPNLQFKKLTNTSVRKRACQVLLNNDVPDTHAIHITGHVDPQSLNQYRTITNKQQQQMSNMLAGAPETPDLPAVTPAPREVSRAGTSAPTLDLDLPAASPREVSRAGTSAPTLDLDLPAASPREVSRAVTSAPTLDLDLPAASPREASSLSLSQSLSVKKSVSTSVESALQSLFKDSNIYGGTFNINIQVQLPEPKRPRID